MIPNRPSDSPRPRRCRAALGLSLVAVALFLWFIGVLGGNVREVDPGRFYRSAQLTGASLESAMRRYRIASVVNLRGPQKKAGFYFSELQVCRELGARHRDVSLSAYSYPPPQELAKVVRALDELPRPILVHCQAGSDRTGLVSTLYAHLYEGMPLERAEASQLTWRFGHFSFSASRAMDRFFDLYRQTAHGQDMREWISRTYPSVYAELARRHDPYIKPAKGKE